MSAIEIPFATEMRVELVLGHKTETFRRKRYGEPGDIFSVYAEDIFKARLDRIPGRAEYHGKYVMCLLVAVNPLTLGEVAASHFKAEGFRNTAEFVDYWIDLKGQYNPKTAGWSHVFEVVGASSS